ncbi:hypothetical protein KDK95_08040 [Actinospica sp. MGRD01-02]|uniref:Uncharacterized protein n=1 Tax=Actinospica acidithermotolerans TaxID=2828514 RepID=A0A941E840_9ACTN|nr:hypothetical protein [Actinospica acidithermotolerans]MBR7826247.1 hypothetical protein [Actinospica acidithermotolerans]
MISIKDERGARQLRWGVERMRQKKGRMNERLESTPGTATPQGHPGGSKVGRPKGPDRIARTVRLLEEHDRRLAAEVEHQGLSQQYLIELALGEYFKRLDRQRRRMQGTGEMQADPSSRS